MSDAQEQAGASAKLEHSTYLKVPFEEKDVVKALGARYDDNAKSWTVPKTVDPAPFEKWEPEQRAYINVPIEQKDQAKALGAKFDGKAESWYVPGDLATEKFEKWAGDKPTPELDMKTYLKVPFTEKDEAKELGAKWDAKLNTWYAPEGADRASFEKFKPEQRAYLDVPFKEKDQAKELGAKFDGYAEAWYAPGGADLKNFEKWAPAHDFDPASKAAERREFVQNKEMATAFRELPQEQALEKFPALAGTYGAVKQLESSVQAVTTAEGKDKVMGEARERLAAQIERSGPLPLKELALERVASEAPAQPAAERRQPERAAEPALER